MSFEKSIKNRISGLFMAPVVIVLFMWTGRVSCGAGDLKLNDQEYFECPGFNVLAFENAYTGFFFDEKTSGIMLIHHGVRTATGGAVRLKNTPEQWDQIPTVVERTVSRKDDRVDIVLRYEEFNFNSRLCVESKGAGILISVTLDEPLPEKLEGRAGLSLEFLPSAYFEKTYTADSKTGIFPLYPSNSMEVKPASTKISQFAGHSTFDDRGRSEYVEPLPFAEGKVLVLAPEDPDRRIQIESKEGGDLMLFDGRSVAQNGWFVVRTLIPSDKTGKVAEWLLTPGLIPDWIRPPVIGYSQAGYHPDQEKAAVIELDKNDKLLPIASVFQLNADGEWIEKYSAAVQDWGDYFRYHYIRFDFSGIRDDGLYKIRYGKCETGPFPIGTYVYNEAWHPTLDVWFPVQMDHMAVNEAYRIWHGAAHLDDALQAPVNHQHFDGYAMKDTTETRYKPGERVPGLNIGGWFDAGDYDIRTGAHAATILHFVDTWERFRPERDETFIDPKNRYTDLHRPDGVPDILQQIEHGTLALIAQYRAFGRAIPGIIEPHLHQYHHLGDGSQITDNLNYNPDLAPYESDGLTSGTPDDRWVFTGRMPFNNYAAMSALAAASRALKTYNPTLAEECAATVKAAFADELNQPVPDGPWKAWTGAMTLQASLQLYITTGDSLYRAHFNKELWPVMEKAPERIMDLAVRAVPFMDKAYREKLIPFVGQYKVSNDSMLIKNPYGVPITTRGWAGNGPIIDWAVTNSLLHRQFPELIGPEYTYRGMSYIYGCHPYSNLSFVSGIGVHSKTVAYGSNRAEFSFIAGGVVPGILLIKPDFPENKNDWPFLWGENEYVIDICAKYITLVQEVKNPGN